MIEDTEKVRIVNSRFRLELLRLGASMHRFEVRMDDGSWRNIILGASRIEDYLTTNSYMGMTVGRFANRIREARFALDGVTYQLDANEGANHAHGGANGFHARRWSLTGQGSDWARFELRSADGDQGFPGALGVSAHYQLLPDGASVTYEATSDAPTIVNLTTHPYFNLDGEGAGDCDSHELRIPASRYTPNDDSGIPTGEVRAVACSAMDFRDWRHLGAARDRAEVERVTRGGGFDHSLIVDGSGMREFCQLRGSRGTTLRILSDQPALQVYGGDHFDGTQIGTSGVGYVRRAGIALEPQGYPDAPNNPHFPSAVLRPGETYQTTTAWLVSPMENNPCPDAESTENGRGRWQDAVSVDDRCARVGRGPGHH